ncbi:hypothetical protein B0H63DRAFT_519814 [Podospora didyma]|uniref:Uncharacterized protein n=1 Tax=Podospora didyma TaxID=330526 RepID=A0AAE0NZR6_9PEZI|nr:hypothetical protein B0H63DRAFT_519814 [Podospora didyma]
MSSPTDREGIGGISESSLALTAVVLAAGAFLISIFQAILQYLTSNVSCAECYRPTIGEWHRLVKWWWSFCEWRLRIEYPVLDLNLENTLKGYVDAKKNSILGDDNMDNIDILLKERDSRIGWLAVQRINRLRWWHLAASWAQLILCLGIRDKSEWLLRMSDADTVSTSLDTPTQRIDVFELGCTAFVLGFRSVEIDAVNQIFKATSPVGTITTQDILSFGRFFDLTVTFSRSMLL